MAQLDLYDPAFVSRLFDEMARTYGVVNLIASLGFARRWRRQCLQSIPIPPNATVLDLMCGMGELCPDLLRMLGPEGRIHALDLSPAMCAEARKLHSTHDPTRLHIIQADALNCPIADESVDVVISTFGQKTFHRQQLIKLGEEVHRILRPGGQFSFLEISVPKFRLLQWPYMAYLHYIIPWIGKLAMGNRENYRLLGVYTDAFQNCRHAVDAFTAAGLHVQYQTYFFGCATGISGWRPLIELSSPKASSTGGIPKPAQPQL